MLVHPEALLVPHRFVFVAPSSFQLVGPLLIFIRRTGLVVFFSLSIVVAIIVVRRLAPAVPPF